MFFEVYFIFLSKFLIMKINKTTILVIIFLVVSCASKKDVYYFQDNNLGNLQNSFKFLNIQPGDILDIQVKALKPESVVIFQSPSTFLPQQQIQNRIIDGYLVGEDGSINLPILGSINTSEHNTQTLAHAIEDSLSLYIKDPNVKIRLLNFRISVLGEVLNPGTFTVFQERISVAQALGLAGDLTINGNRKEVLLIRNEKNKMIYQSIDLTSSGFMNSEYNFLKQNDIIYVSPNKARVASSGLVGDTKTLVSVMSLIVSLFILITR